MKSQIEQKHSIFFGNTAYDKLRELITIKKYDKILIFSDSNTQENCLPNFQDQLSINHLQKNTEIKNKLYHYKVKPGEVSKNLDESKKIIEFLILNGFKRNSLIINLGGGLITDLGGFIASIYLRGIEFVNVPTSLLGMVDASIGGKTGVDLNNLKNIIGSFNNANLILIDTSFLSTLSERQMRSGFSEMIKHSLIDSRNHWEKIKVINDCSDINEKIIYNSIKTKIDIVESDPKESGIRKFLNYGHTLGHAIESYFLGTKKEILHGEAILIGLILESFLSHKILDLELKDVLEIKDFIMKFSKKISFDQDDIENIIKLLKFDKKNKSNKAQFVLLEDIGKPSFNNESGFVEIKDAFEFYRL